MKNCHVEATQIASVMAPNAQNSKIYGPSPLTLPGQFTSPSPSGTLTPMTLNLQLSTFVTKPNLYPKKGHC